MVHTLYITDAIVCGSFNHNTADKNYLLFTRDMGMIFATARSVREERSKQRSALQDFSIIRVSLIKGKSGWRIGSTESLGNLFLEAEGRLARGGVTYLVKMLRRYVQGEQAMSEVFDDLVEAMTVIAKSDDVFNITMWQNVAMARLLHTLGYAVVSDTLRPLITAQSIEAAVDWYVPAHEGEIDCLVEQASTMSHL